MHRAFVPVFAAAVLASATACSRNVDVDKVPVGADVQLTRDDGGVVAGKLAERDADVVRVSTAHATKTVPRTEIADVQVVDKGKPPTLPAVAKFREYTVPDDTPLSLSIETPIGSETSKVEDPVVAKVIAPVIVEGIEVIPAGSVVRGHVTAVQPTGKVKGRAMLALSFDSLSVGDTRYSIAAAWSAEAESAKKSDVEKIGAGAAGGAIIGGILGGKKGAATGAAVGGGAGTAWVLSTEGKPISLGSGADLRVSLRNAVEIRVPLKPSN